MQSGVRTALDQGIDSFVRRRHGNDFYILPAKPRASKGCERDIPVSQLGRVLSGEPFAFDVVDGLDGGVLAHEQPYQEGRAPHHQTHIGNVRKRVTSADLQPIRPLIS